MKKQDLFRTSTCLKETINYLEDELSKWSLSKDLATIYLTILHKYSEEDEVQRPLFTFKLPKFDDYLRFFKRYNLIFPGINRNTFMLSDNVVCNWDDVYHLTEQEAIKISKDL